MLSTFGRAAVQRLPLRPIATSPVVSRLASRAATTQPGLVAVLVSNTSSSGALRSFATKAEGTKDAKKPAKKTTTTKASSTKPKKAAAKPKPKPKPKKKVAAKKKPVVKKKKAAPKVLTPEQKERKELQKARLEKQALKVASLYAEEPKNKLPASGYRAYLAQELKGNKSTTFEGNAERFGKVAASWKALSSSEVSHFNQIAEENRLKNQAVHLAWVESRTPEEINKANAARHLLKRKFNYPKATKHLLKDERQPARIRTAYVYFNKARWASGEFANKAIPEVAAALSAEWKNMTESEKAPYFELQEADKARFERESPVSQ